MRTATFIGLLIITGSSVAAQSSRDSLEILSLENAWNNAHLAADAASLDSLWADEFQVLVPGMRPMSKSGVLDFVRSGRMTFRRYETTGSHITILGDSATVRGTVHRIRMMNNEPVEDHWRFTKRLVRRSYRWRVISWIAEPAVP